MAAEVKAIVLAWMEQNNAGYKRAADHFGLNRNTVKGWQRAHRGNVDETPDEPPTVTPEVVKEVDYQGGKDGEGKGEGGNPRAGDVPASRARPSPAPRMSAALLTPSARAKLRLAVDQQLDFLSDPETISDQKGRADAARALQTLLAGTPDILTFEERTNGLDNDGAAGREDAARRVSRALDPDSTDGPEDGG